jgi:hypothetical protein
LLRDIGFLTGDASVFTPYSASSGGDNFRRVFMEKWRLGAAGNGSRSLSFVLNVQS